MDKLVLNKEQKTAVEYGSGPFLIIAGAGTGKTTVITERIKWLISQKKARPQEILALTFTEKAAREMETRVDMAMPYGYTQMWIMTFHSFCDRVLRDEALTIGLDPGFRLIREAESVKFLKDSLFELKLSYFRPLGNPTKFLTSLLTHFSRLKDEDILPEEYLRYAQKLAGKEPDGGKYLELATAYKTYEEIKIKKGVMDFADLISNTLKLFRRRKDVLGEYQRKFRYLLVDEFQDTNIAQYELVKLLAPGNTNPNLTVVADDNQSIYRFRGAAVSNILFFNKDYKKAETVVLNKNYRSTQEILDSAYTLIKHNDPDTLEASMGISKKLVSQRKITGAKIEFIFQNRVEEEAEAVVQKIKKLVAKKNYRFSDFAILVRANNHSEPFIRTLARYGIPYQFLGPGMLFRQKEIKELIAYLQVLSNPFDSTSLYKVLTMELFKIPGREIVIVANWARRYNFSLFEALDKLVGSWGGKKDLGHYRQNLPFLGQETKGRLVEIFSMIQRHLDLVPKETAGQILFYFLEDSGLLKKIASYKTEKEEKQAQNIASFFEKLKMYESTHEDASVTAVCDFLDLSLELGESPLASDTDWTENNAVNLLTVHSSKGLEFPVVFLVNLVSQRFPTSERKERIPIPESLIKEILPKGDYHLEEERRLFYVGMTRARDFLFLTSANYYGEGKREKKLSPFVVEALGEESLKSSSQNKQMELPLLLWEKISEPAPIPIRHRLNYLSYSQIQTFQMCPLHYKLKYILKIPTAPSAALSFGITIHSTMRDFYQSVITGEQPSLGDLLQFFKKNWLPYGYTSKKHEDLTKIRGENYLTAFLEKSFEKNTLPVALETPFSFPLTRSLKFGGKIDRVDKLEDGRIEIIDYKTSLKIPSQKEADKDLQLTLYALAATKIKDSLFWKKPEEIILSLYFFEEQKKISTVRTQDQLDKAQDEIIKIASEIETSSFSCSGIEMCRNCEYRLFCEANS